MPFPTRRDDARLRRRHGILALALGAALVVTTGVHDAAAKRKKGSVVATINGKHRRWNAKKITVTVVADSVTIVATVKRPRRLNQFIPGVALTCQLDLTGTFPVTPQFPQLCVVGYSEFRFSRNPDPKMWGGSNSDDAAEVTFDSLSGNRLTGRFHGTLTSQNTPPNPPVSIENGTFSIDVGS